MVKKLVTLCAISALVVPAGAQGHTEAQLHRVLANHARTIKTLRTQVRNLRAFIACERDVLAITQYDLGGGNTALDVTADGDPVGAYIPMVNPSCVEGATAFRFRVLRNIG